MWLPLVEVTDTRPKRESGQPPRLRPLLSRRLTATESGFRDLDSDWLPASVFLEAGPGARLNDGERLDFAGGVCFKCGERQRLPARKVCGRCFGSRPKREPERRWVCGCRLKERQPPSILGGDDPNEARIFAAARRRACVACQGRGRIRDSHHYLGGRHPAGWFGSPSQGPSSSDSASSWALWTHGESETGTAARHGHSAPGHLDPAGTGFLRARGWFVETVTTNSGGKGPGRPPIGIDDEDGLRAAIVQALIEDAAFSERLAGAISSGRSQSSIRTARRLLVALVPMANTVALAQLLEVSDRTIRLDRAGVSDISSKGGGDDSPRSLALPPKALLNEALSFCRNVDKRKRAA